MTDTPQKPLLYHAGQRIRIAYRWFEATVVAHHGYYPANGENEWEISIDGRDGHTMGSDSQIKPLSDTIS